MLSSFLLLLLFINVAVAKPAELLYFKLTWNKRPSNISLLNYVCICGFLRSGVGWMGGDGTYIRASLWFYNIDKLWHLPLLHFPVHTIQSMIHIHIHRRACTHRSPSNQSRLLHVSSSLKPLLYVLLPCPLFSSWWQNEFAYFSQGVLIIMH